MKNKLFEDFIDDIDVQDVNQNIHDDLDERTDVASLECELYVVYQERKSKERFAAALRLFMHKVELIAAHSRFIDSIKEFKFDTGTIYQEKRIYDIDGIKISSPNNLDDNSLEHLTELYCTIVFVPNRKPTGRLVSMFYNDVKHIMKITGTVDLPANRTIVIRKDTYFFEGYFISSPKDKDYAEEVYQLARVFIRDYSYPDYLKDFHNDGFEFMMRYYYFYGEFGDQIEEMWKHVKKIGHFVKTDDSKLLPSYIKEKHPVAGSTELFGNFGTFDYATSSPWSPTLRWIELREHCNTHGCTVYLMKDSKVADDGVYCVYDGFVKQSRRGEEVYQQVVTSTTGHEVGVVSKEMALSCFVSAEEAEQMCEDFFGGDYDYEEDY